VLMPARHKEICTAVNLENRSTVHRKKKREKIVVLFVEGILLKLNVV
jgi:hypothetical protein